MSEPTCPERDKLIAEMVDYFIDRTRYGPGSELRWAAGEFLKQAEEAAVSAREAEHARELEQAWEDGFAAGEHSCVGGDLGGPPMFTRKNPHRKRDADV